MDGRGPVGRGSGGPGPRPSELALLAWASDLAAEGHFDRAEEVLSGLGPDEQSSSEVLDLRARMLAQRKRFPEAEALWRQVLRLSPGRPGVEEALALCERLRRRPRWLAYPREVALVLVGVCLLIGACLVVVAMRAPGARPIAAAPGPTALESGGTVEVPVPSQPAARFPLLPEGRVPGMRQTLASGVLALTFETPFFNGDSTLLPDSGRRLSALAEVLGERDDLGSVEIVGHTDGAPVPKGRAYRDNAALALARAVVIAEELRKGTGLRAEAIVIRVGSELERPWRDTEQGPDRRNRTVTIKISKRAPAA